MTQLVEDARNVFLMTEGGSIVFLWRDAGAYEVHLHFLKPYRGLNALRAFKAADAWMFTHTDCMEIRAIVSDAAPRVAILAANSGRTREFHRPGVYPTDEGPVGASFWRLQYQDWVKQTPSLVQSGLAFLTQLGLEPREEIANRHLGAAVETIHAGQPDKAAVLYNRWALFACLPGLMPIAHNPLVMQFENLVLQFIPDREIKIIRKVRE